MKKEYEKGRGVDATPLRLDAVRPGTSPEGEDKNKGVGQEIRNPHPSPDRSGDTLSLWAKGEEAGWERIRIIRKSIGIEVLGSDQTSLSHWEARSKSLSVMPPASWVESVRETLLYRIRMSGWC